MSKFTFWFIIIVTLFSVVDSELNAQTRKPSEYQVKTAFLYNFAKFVEWPSEAFADSSDPIIIGILGKDPFGNDLEKTIKGKTVKGREITIKHSKQIEKFRSCHILFISMSEKRNLKHILKNFKKSSILTVSEIENFTQYGGIIGFVMKQHNVRFEINMDAAERSGLQISSKLLKVAKAVKDKH